MMAHVGQGPWQSLPGGEICLLPELVLLLFFLPSSTSLAFSVMFWTVSG